MIKIAELLDPEILDMIRPLVEKLEGREFWYGRNRVTIRLKNNVIKLPRNGCGVTDNDWEGSVSNSPEFLNHPDYVQYPHTRLCYVDELPILFMEAVTDASYEECMVYLNTPKGESNWTWSVDGGQVGFTKRGRLVAYDYGLR